MHSIKTQGNQRGTDMTAKRHINSRNFTLVELLVVIVIISIILSMTAPAFRRLMVGNSVDSAARMVSAQLMLARAEAIAQRRYVAVIMPRSDEDGSTYESTDTYNRQSFRAAYVDKNLKFEDWVPGTQWAFLPTGAVIASIATFEEAVDDKVKSIKYTTDGDSESWTFVDSEKWVPENDGSSITKVTNVPIYDKTQEIRAVVFKPNGMADKRLYITVMEGLCSNNIGEDIERANKNNIRVMEIARHTGQVRYLTVDFNNGCMAKLKEL